MSADGRSQAASDEVTRLLRNIRTGGPSGVGDLLPLVYEQLRAIANERMAGERRDHTLQATALVHEAYLRLVNDASANDEANDAAALPWSCRAHFFAAAAEAMRRILIEHARTRGRIKRGGDGQARAAKRQPLNLLNLAIESDPDEILMLDEAICRLEREDPDSAQVVRLRFFAGLSIDDTASALGVSPSTVDREWAYARAKLHRMMRE